MESVTVEEAAGFVSFLGGGSVVNWKAEVEAKSHGKCE